MSAADAADLWWKNAVVYCLDVETFLDSDGDGIGDFTGLTDRIDYLAQLGVSCVWLMPFFPTAHRDDGYDITDFYSVDPRLGSLGDFAEFLRTAHDRGLRVIIDLVVNHTSDRHPWFRAARSSRDSEFRDFYVWADEPPATPTQGVVFPDEEDSIWTFDERAGQYYLHHFYSHQPDLNITNPRVVDEIAKLAGFWLELGVDGFRVDAVPFLIERGGTGNTEAVDPHRLLRKLRALMSRRRGDSIMLGEVNMPPEPLVDFFGDEDGDELHVLFNFPVMQAMYLALARRSPKALSDALDAMADKPIDSQWATFVRNHDELTLDQLTDAERGEVFEAFGPDADMQLFGRGLRRRLPPMLGGDERRVRMVYSLLFTLPGTPVLFYGEEIGMGENLDIDGRLSVRTPMQWSPAPSAGFSTAKPSRLRRRPPEGPYGPLDVNVTDQLGDADSLLSWMGEAIRCRRRAPEFGWGEFRQLDTDNDLVLAHSAEWHSRIAVAAHNFSDQRQIVRLTTKSIASVGADPDAFAMVHLHGDRHAATWDDGEITIDLEPYGYHWLRLDASPNPLP
ncbi:MAG TPA: alpha-amylase family protein [Ilumatobacter sp.]|nr:alpha-amylase family protein [Ilumatobacter sp.]